MISLGLLDKNWSHGLNEKEAEVKLNQVLSNGQDSKFSQAEPFANEEMNQEVRDMVSLGLLDKNWSHGLNEKEAEVKFNQILNSQNSATPTPKYVENEKQKRLFQDEINQVKRLHGNEFDLQIKELYHATKAPRNLICSRGLDQRLSTFWVVWPRNLFLNDDVRKCEQYLYNVKGSAIYKCSVILGDIKEYPDGKADPQLKQEPEKENGDYYDSVKGNMDGFNEYVIYDNRRCLINYRIVLEGTEDEDSDKEDEIAKEEKKEEFMETWKRHMNYLVDSCKHDDEEDAEVEKEIRNIEKIRLEIRMRREMKTEKPLSKLSYDLLREERKKWKSSILNAENKSEMPSNKKSDEKKLPSNQKLEAEEFNLDNSREEITRYPQVADDPELANDMQSNHDSVLSRFIEITHCDDMELAKCIVENQHFHLDNAVNEYRAFMS
ncbi:unnamed protein product [Acanthosepion pharaonis]|uniref:Uncharacterized protein n=1 Tax=Acanthosepion pharaonis TaxID=158019 RepID=A0A812E2K8_ACAPH|nr:unnamed protein product [Sepia pharaonis]